jgi:DNA-binding transcriptional LysR family regulator
MDLVKEHVDLAIRIGHLSDSALYATYLFDMPLKLYASPSYLASLPRIQIPEDLKHCNLIRLKTNGNSNVGLLRLQKDKQTVEQTLQGNLSANDMGVVISLTESAAGIALIHEAFVASQVANGILVNVLPDWRSIKIPVHAVTTSRNPSARVKALIAYLKEQLAYLNVSD